MAALALAVAVVNDQNSAMEACCHRILLEKSRQEQKMRTRSDGPRSF